MTTKKKKKKKKPAVKTPSRKVRLLARFQTRIKRAQASIKLNETKIARLKDKK